MLYKQYECVFKYDSKHGKFLQIILSFIPKIALYQENARKVRVMCEHINQIVYFIRKSTAIWCSVLWHKELLETFAVQLFLQRCYVWMLPFICSLRREIGDENVPCERSLIFKIISRNV